MLLRCGNATGGRAGRPPGAWAVGRPTLHGGPVVLRPVMATPCWKGENGFLTYRKKDEGAKRWGMADIVLSV